MNNNKVDPFHADFDWFAFLEQDISVIPEYILKEASDLADNWVTCACGQLCRNLPRGLGKKPKDKKLSDLGMQFSRILYEINLEPSNEARKEAIEILKAIETRTTTLLKKLQII